MKLTKFSNQYFKEAESSHRRVIYKAMGYTNEDLSKPLIGVINTWSEVSPGHAHLREIAKQVKAEIWQNGGTPFEFGIFATCGNIAIGTENLKYELVIRDVLTANFIYLLTRNYI